MPTFYGYVDLIQNELRNATIQNLGSAPASPHAGQLYYNTTNNVLWWYNGTTWISASGAVASSTVTNLAVANTATAGSAGTFSQGDHVHGMPAWGASVTAETSYGLASALGSAATLAHSDHTHGTPSLTGNVASNSAVADVASVGVSTFPARDDHKHGREAWGAPAAQTSFGLASATGSALTVPHSDHTHGTPPLPAVNALAATTGPLNMAGYQINNVADPTNPQDAATKNYVDGAINGLSWKAPCVAGTTANITLSGTQTIDGVAVVAGNRVLVKNQTTAANNGIYVVAAGAWTRATDSSTAAQLENEATYIDQGTTLAGTGWTLTTPLPITVGTTALTYTQFTGAGTYTAGNGLTLSGNVFSALAADTSVTISGAGIAVNTGVIATVASLANYVPTSRTITAGNGLTGGGALSANLSFAVGAGTGILSTAGQVAVDTTVIATVASVNAAVAGVTKKYATTLNGTASPETITHNLNTRDISVTVINGASPYNTVQVDWQAATVNTVSIIYNPALGAGYRVVVIG